MIARLEGEIHVLVNRLCDKLLAEREVVDVAMAYSCFTTDTISSYCFGETFGMLDQKSWRPNFREATLAVLKPVFVFRFFPFLVEVTKLGEWFLDYLPEEVALMIRTLKITIPGYIYKTKADLDAGMRRERPTVFGSLLESDMDERDKQPWRLADEAVAVVCAGTETTAWTLAVITYHLLNKPQLLTKLKSELSTEIVDPKCLPPWTTLEKLPYLSAVIQEGLRLSYGVAARTARVPTQEDLIYRGAFNKTPVQLVLPRGYAVGMSAAITHHDESVFPDSYEFVPERWLNDKNRRRKDVERGMLAFSKGSRACLGKK